MPPKLFFIKLFKHIPYAEHIHNAERAVVQTVAGTHVSGLLIPEMSAVVGTDVAVIATVVVSLEDLKNTCVTVAISVARLGEVAIGEVLYVSDMSESDSVAVLSYIGNEQYGINIKYIDNIVRMQKITRVPMAQEYFKGVINLRGEIIPVMSIRRKLELDDDVITNKTRIIIAKVDNASIGFVVDEVKEVVTLDANSIERVATAEAASEITHCITSIGKKNGELISLLDLNLVAGEKEVS